MTKVRLIWNRIKADSSQAMGAQSCQARLQPCFDAPSGVGFAVGTALSYRPKGHTSVTHRRCGPHHPALRLYMLSKIFMYRKRAKRVCGRKICDAGQGSSDSHAGYDCSILQAGCLLGGAVAAHAFRPPVGARIGFSRSLVLLLIATSPRLFCHGSERLPPGSGAG